LVRKLRQGAVQADGLARIELDRGLDQEDADEAEHDHAGKVAEDGDGLVPPPDGSAHFTRLRVLQEVLRDAPIPLVERDADDESTGETDDPGAARPAEYARGRLGRMSRRSSARGEEHLHRAS